MYIIQERIVSNLCLELKGQVIIKQDLEETFLYSIAVSAQKCFSRFKQFPGN